MKFDLTQTSTIDRRRYPLAVRHWVSAGGVWIAQLNPTMSPAEIFG